MARIGETPHSDGQEVTLKTKRAFADALSKKGKILDDSLKNEKEENDFLSGVLPLSRQSNRSPVKAHEKGPSFPFQP